MTLDGHIVLVDDEENLRLLVVEELKAAGYSQVEAFSSGEQFLRDYRDSDTPHPM